MHYTSSLDTKIPGISLNTNETGKILRCAKTRPRSPQTPDSGSGSQAQDLSLLTNTRCSFVITAQIPCALGNFIPATTLSQIPAIVIPYIIVSLSPFKCIAWGPMTLDQHFTYIYDTVRR